MFRKILKLLSASGDSEENKVAGVSGAGASQYGKSRGSRRTRRPRRNHLKVREPREYDDWLEWAEEEINLLNDDVPSREDKQARAEALEEQYAASKLEAVAERLGFTPSSLENKRAELDEQVNAVLNDIDAYDASPEDDETFRRDFYEQAVNELKYNGGIGRVSGGEEVDLRDLDNFVEYVHTSGSEPLKSGRNSYIRSAHNSLRVWGEAEGLNIVRTTHADLDITLEDVGSGVLYAVSRDDLDADLPNLEGYSDVYMISTDGDVRVDADRVGSGAHLYAESIHGDAHVTVDGVDEDGMVDVNSTHGESCLTRADM